MFVGGCIGDHPSPGRQNLSVAWQDEVDCGIRVIPAAGRVAHAVFWVGDTPGAGHLVGASEGRYWDAVGYEADAFELTRATTAMAPVTTMVWSP